MIEGASAVPETAPRATPGSPDGPRPADRLLEVSRQLEGAFMQYLTKALRSTVPNEGHADAPGADIYGSLFDEHLAQVMAQHTGTGIAEALYRQLAEAGRDPSIRGSRE